MGFPGAFWTHLFRRENIGFLARICGSKMHPCIQVRKRAIKQEKNHPGKKKRHPSKKTAIPARKKTIPARKTCPIAVNETSAPARKIIIYFPGKKNLSFLARIIRLIKDASVHPSNKKSSRQEECYSGMKNTILGITPPILREPAESLAIKFQCFR